MTGYRGERNWNIDKTSSVLICRGRMPNGRWWFRDRYQGDHESIGPAIRYTPHPLHNVVTDRDIATVVSSDAPKRKLGRVDELYLQRKPTKQLTYPFMRNVCRDLDYRLVL